MAKKIWMRKEDGYVLIVGVMLLFVSTILGLMVISSSKTEIILSGAQQRYEDELNTAEGGADAEAAAVGTGVTIIRNSSQRSYDVVDPSTQDTILSPTSSETDALFDPGEDMDTSSGITVTLSPETPATQWPMENLLQSDKDSDDRYDYHYRVVYSHYGEPPKGFDASSFSSYFYDISARKNTQIDMGGQKVGPKMEL
jgi:hypothetical protein